MNLTILLLASQPLPLPPWAVVLLVCGFPFVFAAIWCGVCLLISGISGWSRLAEKYPGSETPAGKCFSWQRGRMGVANYKNSLVIHTSPEGLHLAVMKLFRVGHPPIFIPWSDIHNATFQRLFWSETVAFEAGHPPLAKIHLRRDVFADVPIQIVDPDRAGAPPPVPGA